MKITPRNQKVNKFQQGGAMPPVDETAEAPVEQPMGGEEQDPIMMIAQMAMQALQGQDCEAAMQVCQAFLEIVQQMQGGASEEPQGEPVYRRGGTLVRKIRK